MEADVVLPMHRAPRARDVVVVDSEANGFPLASQDQRCSEERRDGLTLQITRVVVVDCQREGRYGVLVHYRLLGGCGRECRWQFGHRSETLPRITLAAERTRCGPAGVVLGSYRVATRMRMIEHWIG